jgi:hypothetical protein
MLIGELSTLCVVDYRQRLGEMPLADPHRCQLQKLRR